MYSSSSSSVTTPCSSIPVDLFCRGGVPQVFWSPELPPTPPPAAVTAAMSPPAAAPPAWTAGAALPCPGSVRARGTPRRMHVPRRSRRPPGDWCRCLCLQTVTCACVFMFVALSDSWSLLMFVIKHPLVHHFLLTKQHVEVFIDVIMQPRISQHCPACMTSRMVPLWMKYITTVLKINLLIGRNFTLIMLLNVKAKHLIITASQMWGCADSPMCLIGRKSVF